MSLCNYAADFGLLYYNARWYDPSLGRFAQADTIVPAGVQGYDRYAYVNNSPVNFNDPTGHVCSDPDDPTQSCDGADNVGDISNGGGLDSNFEKNDCYIGDNIRCGRYFSVSIGLDAPTIAILAGAGLTVIGLPEVGVPLALTGATFEVCTLTATGLCAVGKLLNVNVTTTIDENGNLYMGPQISWGKSILPIVAFSDNLGGVVSDDANPPTESEMIDTLSGIYFSAGTIGTGGVSYSPGAKANRISYYLVGLPEVLSANFGYNWHIYDFSP